MNINISKDDLKDVIKWAAIIFIGFNGKDFVDDHAGEIKEFSQVLFTPLLEETRRIRFNQHTVIYNQHVEQYQRAGYSLDKAIEKANEH